MKQEAVMELAPEATAERKAVDERGGAKEAVNAVEEGTVAVEEVKVGEGAERAPTPVAAPAAAATAVTATMRRRGPSAHAACQKARTHTRRPPLCQPQTKAARLLP